MQFFVAQFHQQSCENCRLCQFSFLFADLGSFVSAFEKLNVIFLIKHDFFSDYLDSFGSHEFGCLFVFFNLEYFSTNDLHMFSVYACIILYKNIVKANI